MPEPSREGRERDLVLGPTEQILVLDCTKGQISVLVGPYHTTLSNTDQPVVFNPRTGTFDRVGLDNAIQVCPTADEGAYIVLSNPAVSSSDAHPKPGSNMSPGLEIGRRVNMPGPASFPLWPGQAASVIQGHRLHSNQFLFGRVYNEEEAAKNWGSSVIKPQAGSGAQGEPVESGVPAGPEAPNATPIQAKPPQLTMGQLFVVKGTDVSFYIPPTGVEVVPDSGDRYVRDAVTLEQLEYCVLLDESGEKRYVSGPAVVFPAPTEVFVERDGGRKFRAIELNEGMGVYLKVTSPYRGSDGTEHEVGEELFITGKETKLYFPRPEHSIIKYGDEEIHFAVAVPDGDARYVLDKLTGQVDLVRGPQMFLADPRHQVLVRRVLDPRTVGLYYPGNQEALDYNARLAALTRARTEQFVPEKEATRDFGDVAETQVRAALQSTTEVAGGGFAGKSFRRRTAFTPPRTVTLDSKYDGAVAVDVWTGYAIQVVSKTGQRRVVTGPATVLLAFDEKLEVLEMSTGTPKTDKQSVRTVYLRVLNNKVSDQVEAETRDMVRVGVTLSYRVNFEGEPDQWFGVENYVKLLVEHLRSMLRNAVKQHGVENFNRDAITIIRDTVLGVSEAVAGQEPKPRPGRQFVENGMRVYDVEVLAVSIGDGQIAGLLTGAQHDSVRQALQIAAAERSLEATRRLEEIKRQTARTEADTETQRLALERERVVEELGLELERIAGDFSAREKQQLTAAMVLKHETKAAEVRRASAKTEADQRLAISEAEQALALARLTAEVEATVQRAKALGPEVVAALQAFADKDLTARVAQSMSPLAILGGTSITEVASNLLKGTILEHVLNRPTTNDGASSRTTAPSRLP